MYESFYNLSEKPFSISTDPRFLWCGETHNEALANLKYGVMERNGFIVLTGDIGTGKTTLVNALLEMLSDDVLVANINHPSLESTEFLMLAAKTFDPSADVTGKSDLLLFFNSFLRGVHRDGNVALLIVDEAHRLSVELLEEMRMLSNIEQHGKPLLNIIFVGQNELKPMLLSPQCRALRQRITLYYEIQLLSEEETAKYVGHRLNVSGLQDKLFSSSALREIFAFSQGNPRQINILCDRALLTGFLRARRTIDADIIRECAREITIEDNPKSRISENADHPIATGRHTLNKELEPPAEATVQSLRPETGLVGKTGRKTVKELLLTAGALREKVLAVTHGLPNKHRGNVTPVILMAGMAAVFLAFTFGVLKLTDTAATRNIPGHRKESAVGSASSLSRSPAEDRTEPGMKDPAASVKTVTAQPSVKAAASEIDASVPVPLPTRDADTPSNAHARPDPVEMAETALEERNYKKALAVLEADRDSPRDENPTTLNLYAKALVGRAGEIANTAPLEAETLLLKAVEIAPGTTQAFLMLGKYYTQIRAYTRAVDAFQNAIRLAPRMPDALFNLGFIYATLGKYVEAEKAFSRVVQLAPPYLDKTLFNLAVVQQKLGKKAASLANLEKAVTLAPENEKALAYLGRLKGTGNKNIPGQTR